MSNVLTRIPLSIKGSAAVRSGSEGPFKLLESKKVLVINKKKGSNMNNIIIFVPKERNQIEKVILERYNDTIAYSNLCNCYRQVKLYLLMTTFFIPGKILSLLEVLFNLYRFSL